MAGKLLHAAGDVLVAVAAGRRHLTPLHHNNSQPHEYNHHNNNHNYNHNKHYNDERHDQANHNTQPLTTAHMRNNPMLCYACVLM